MQDDYFKLLERARELKTEGNTDQSIKVYKLIHELSPKSKSVMIELAELLIDKKVYGEAERLLYGVLSLDMNDNYDSLALLFLGNIYMENGRTHDARIKFNELRKRKEYFGVEALAKLNLNLGNINGFNKMYDRFIELSDNKYLNENNPILDILDINDKKEDVELLKSKIYEAIHSHDYVEAYEYLNELLNMDFKNLISLNEVKLITYYLKYNIGMIDNEDITNDSYLTHQMSEYDYDEAIEHSATTFERNKLKNKQIYLLNDEDIESLYEELSKLIRDMEPESNTYVDKYMVELDRVIGYDYGNETNMVKVLTIANTKNIVMIYPTRNKKLNKERVR